MATPGPPWIRQDEGAVLLRIHAKPGASKTAVGPVDRWRGALSVRVAAPAEGGQANEELIRAVAAALQVPTSAVSVERGARSRDKVVRVASLSLADARRALEGSP
jgi:hypothetical protein